MSECTHDCSSCQAECSSRTQSFLEKPHEQSSIKKIIGVISGKGGVGKTSVAAAHAGRSAREGCRTLLVSADMAHNLGDLFGTEVASQRCLA